MTLGELRIVVIYPKHLVILNLSTLPKTGNLLRFVLDADGSFSEEENVDEVTWNSLDGIISEDEPESTAGAAWRGFTQTGEEQLEICSSRFLGWGRGIYIEALTF